MRSSATPASGFNVEQDDKAWTVTLDLPGVAREELSITIEGTVVRIETKAEAKRQFKAAYELPQDIDAEASAAKLENGVLTLTLAKKVPVSNARQIESQVSRQHVIAGLTRNPCAMASSSVNCNSASGQRGLTSKA